MHGARRGRHGRLSASPCPRRISEAETAARAAEDALAGFGEDHRAGAVFPALTRIHLACRTGDRDLSRAGIRLIMKSPDHHVWAAVGCLWHQRTFGETPPDGGAEAELTLPYDVEEFRRRWSSVAPLPL